MQQVQLTDEITRNFVIFRGSLKAKEGMLYLSRQDGYLYKVYNSELSPRIQNNILGLNFYYPIKHVLQTDMLLLRDNMPVGVRLEYLKDHQLGSKFAKGNGADFEERLQACKTFIEGLKAFHNHNYILGDIKLDNLMIKDGDSTLIDVYDGCFDDGSPASIDYSFSGDIVLANLTVLSILYGINFEDIIFSKNNNYFINFISSSSLALPLKNYIIDSSKKSQISVVSFLVVILYMYYNKIEVDVSSKIYIDQFLNSDYLDKEQISKEAKRLR